MCPRRSLGLPSRGSAVTLPALVQGSEAEHGYYPGPCLLGVAGLPAAELQAAAEEFMVTACSFECPWSGIQTNDFTLQDHPSSVSPRSEQQVAPNQAGEELLPDPVLAAHPGSEAAPLSAGRAGRTKCGHRPTLTTDVFSPPHIAKVAPSGWFCDYGVTRKSTWMEMGKGCKDPFPAGFLVCF